MSVVTVDHQILNRFTIMFLMGIAAMDRLIIIIFDPLI